jgi:hypothetical protein
MKSKYYIGILSEMLLAGYPLKAQIADNPNFRNDDAGLKEHTVHLQEVHHPPGRHHMSEVLLQEDPDHLLRDRLP